MNKLNIIQCHIGKEFDNQLLIEYFVKNNKNTFDTSYHHSHMVV